MNRNNYYLPITGLLIAVFYLGIHHADASISTGTIDASFKLTQICQDVTCTDVGNLNWKPTITAATVGALPVSITDTAITGHIWGDEIGWVNLSPTGAGITVNPNTGVLSGKAFAQNGSWINFNVTGQQVVLVDNGNGSNFSGYAWVSGAYGGWIKFDCSSNATCIKTDWRAIPYRPTSSGSSGYSPCVPNGGNNFCKPVQSVNIVPTVIPTTPQIPPMVVPPNSTTTSNSVKNNFDNNGDGIPDFFPKEIKYIKPDVPESDTSKIITQKDSLDYYRQLFPNKKIDFIGDKDCTWCIVIKKNTYQNPDRIFVTKELLSFGFIPKQLQIPIPLGKGLQVDFISSILVLLAGAGIRRFLIQNIITLIFK